MGREIVLSMTGGSGAALGVRALEVLSKLDFRVHLVVSSVAERILEFETGKTLEELKTLAWKVHPPDDFFAPIASGSHDFGGMIVAPSSMKTIGLVAHGISSDLVARVADVCLKERRPLVFVFREAPLSSVHLHNLLRVVECGAFVIPAVPAFYNRPTTIEEVVDYVVGKALDCLRIPHGLYPRWKEERESNAL